MKPDVIVETDVAHGGTLVYYASLCKAMGRGRIIGVDIEIRKQNREAIESHELAPYITLIGNSVEESTITQVKSRELRRKRAGSSRFVPHETACPFRTGRLP